MDSSYHTYGIYKIYDESHALDKMLFLIKHERYAMEAVGCPLD